MTAMTAVTADSAEVEQLPQRESWSASGVIVEIVLGLWLLFLFLLALAWDPFDRRFGSRAKRLAERATPHHARLVVDMREPVGTLDAVDLVDSAVR